MSKWVRTDICNYVGCDFALVSVKEAVRRYNVFENKMRKRDEWPAKFGCTDLGATDLEKEGESTTFLLFCLSYCLRITLTIL